MKKIRVLYVISTLRNCGPVTILYNIIKHLDKRIFEVTVLTLSPENENSRENEFKKIGVNIIKLNLTRLEMLVYGKKRIRKLFKNSNWDIVHTHGYRPDIYISNENLNINTVNTIHNFPHIDYIHKRGKLLGSYMLKKQIKALRQIKYPVACSKSVQKSIKNNFGINTLCVQNGIDIKKYTSVDLDIIDDIKNKLDITKNKKILLWVGAFSNEKNPKIMIDAFNQIDCENYLLIMLGGGKLINKYREYASNNQNIIIKGSVLNIEEYLNISDVFISTSRTEGMPNAVLEALSIGLPVILSNIEPHIEIINESKTEIGKLFDLESQQSLVNCIGQIEEINKLKNNSLDLMSYKFNDKSMSKGYENIYLDIVNQ